MVGADRYLMRYPDAAGSLHLSARSAGSLLSVDARLPASSRELRLLTVAGLESQAACSASSITRRGAHRRTTRLAGRCSWMGRSTYSWRRRVRSRRGRSSRTTTGLRIGRGTGEAELPFYFTMSQALWCVWDWVWLSYRSSRSPRERERKVLVQRRMYKAQRETYSGPGGYEMCFISVLKVTVLTTEYCTCHLQGADVNHSRRARAAVTSSTLPAPPAASPPPSHSRLCRPRCRSAS